ncbi:hypothetical protein OOT46_26005 [Aquabacterium sp. A7-Y]|uniref:hypothetical protein n=1 Tax=Aquabacterium sp. A7-Y TaxID=1349605 RepID=UPI00223DD303|nr:hypothetical protein [Aquabacterium sp. A7-Y]MCW7541269.1 hypothetical protein [Aquabacterium sp. A7-Y]
MSPEPTEVKAPRWFARHLLWLEHGSARLYLGSGSRQATTWTELAAVTLPAGTGPSTETLREVLAHRVGRWWRSLEVVLGAGLSSIFTVDLGEVELPQEVALAAIAHRHAELWGQGAPACQLLFDETVRQGWVPVFVCPGGLPEQIGQAARAAGMSLRSVQVAACWAVAHRARALRGDGPNDALTGWTVYEAPDRLVGVLERAGVLRGVVDLPPREEVAALRRRLHVWERRLGIVDAVPGPLVLLHAPSSVWRIEPGEEAIVSGLLPEPTARQPLAEVAA